MARDDTAVMKHESSPGGACLAIEMNRKEEAIVILAQAVERRLMKLVLDARDWYSLLELKRSGAYKEVVNRETGKPFTWAEVAAGYEVDAKTANQIVEDIDSLTRPQYEALERSGANLHVIRKLGSSGGSGNARVAKLIERGMGGEKLADTEWRHAVQTLQSQRDDAAERANSAEAKLKEKERIVEIKNEQLNKRDLALDKSEKELDKTKEELEKVRKTKMIDGDEQAILDALEKVENVFMVQVSGGLKKINYQFSDRTLARARGVIEMIREYPTAMMVTYAKKMEGTEK